MLTLFQTGSFRKLLTIEVNNVIEVTIQSDNKNLQILYLMYELLWYLFVAIMGGIGTLKRV